MHEVVEKLSVREVVVVPFAYHLTEHRVAFGRQVFKKVVVRNVEVLELRAEADVERDELVVAHIDALEEIESGKIQGLQVVPGKVDHSEVLASVYAYGSKVVVRHPQVIQLWAVVGRKFGSMVVARERVTNAGRSCM